MTEKRHGKGLLFIVTLVLAAGVIKYADIPFAQTVREKAASALSGAANADHVLAVFGGSAMPADTVPAESSGGADDILDRDQTLFPDTVDQTVYPMEFEHTTPTSGTLTSSFGSRLSPITGQPDFATIHIDYIPDIKMVESKSLKLYLFSFRNHGAFHEDCVNIIMNDLIRLMDPKYIEITGIFTPRGGISIYPYCNYGRPGTKYEELAEKRLFNHRIQ